MADAPRDSNFVPASLFEIDGSSGSVMAGQIDQVTGRILVDSAGGGSGTVTDVSVASSNGFAGTVATSTTTAVITLQTTINNPVIGGNGTALVSTTTTGLGSTVVLSNKPTFADYITTPRILLSGTSNQAVFQSGGVTGTLQWTPATSNKTITFPNGSTDFTATGGTSNVLQQASAGAAITVGQLAASALSNGTTGSGAVVLATSPTITTPTIAKLANLVNNGVITTTSNDGTLVVIGVTGTSSAVLSNAPTLTGIVTADTVSAVKLSATTTSTVELRATTTTSVKIGSGTFPVIQQYYPVATETVMLDLAKGNYHRVQMPAGNVTMGLSNQSVGQCFMIDIQQDSVGSRTVSWFATIKWAGGSAITLTTTSTKIDTVGIIITSTSNYQAYVVGQNL